MKKLLLITLTSFFLINTTSSFAYVPPPPSHIVSFQLQAEQWAKTDTARVIVSFNGTITDQDLVNLHKQVLEKLNVIYHSDEWHIITFSREQDKSGLEKIYLRAEIRLPEKALAKLRETAKKISKPGATFEIDAIHFSPSLVDIEKTKNSLRNEIYKSAKKELVDFNHIYPDQHYKLHRITFGGLQPLPLSRQERTVATNFKKVRPQTMAVTVSQKTQLTANVQFISEEKTRKDKKG